MSKFQIRPSRRAALQGLALAGVGALARPAAAGPARPAPLRGGTVAHAVAMHGAPELPEGFANLPYANPRAPKGGRLNIAFLGAFDSLNPFNLRAGTTAQGLNHNIFQTLMARSLDEPFTLYGLVAQWIETNEARDFVLFHLDPDARFSDGSPILAEDVLFTFELLKQKGRPQHRFAFSRVARIEALDAHTVFYDLAGAEDRELPMILALMPVLSKAKVDAERFSDASLDIPTGSGPYRITEMKPGESLILRRIPDYWAAEKPMQKGFANFDEIHINYYRDSNSTFERFKAGLVDYRDEDSISRWLTGYDFPAVRDGRVIRELLPIGAPRGLEGFAFNTRLPLFADARVREALSIMFDFDWINRSLYAGLYTRTESFFDNSELSSIGRPASAGERALLAPFPGAVREDILEGRWRPYETDGTGRDRVQAQLAMDLLREAGWTLDNSTLEKDGRPFSFEIMVANRDQERLALVYASALARIGVTARVRSVDEVQYQRRRQKFDFDMMPGTWIASASPGNEQRNRWSSESAKQEASFNLAGAASPALDGLIQTMLAAHGREAFADAVRAYDRVLLSGFYVVPFFHSRRQMSSHWRRIQRPEVLPRWSAPLFGATLDTWWSVPL